MEEILIMATVIAGVTNGAVQAIKTAIKPNDRYLPVMAIVIGLVLGGLAYFLDVEIGMRLWAGGISGLASVGLFEVGKNARDEIERVGK